MKNIWGKPICTTITQVALVAHIKAAAYSGEVDCILGVFR